MDRLREPRWDGVYRGSRRRGRAGGQAIRGSEALREAVGYHSTPRGAWREPYMATARL